MSMRRVALVQAAVLLAGTPILWGEQPPGHEAISRPSKDVTLSFTRPGRLAPIPGPRQLEDGDMVQAGQLLARLDDEAERAQLAQLKAQAEDDTRVRAAEAQLAQKKVDRDEIKEARQRGAATRLEYEHAELDVNIAELSLELSKFQQKQDRRKYDEAKIQLERMKLRSPITGRVLRLMARPGETVDAVEQVVRVLSIDPLWVDVPVPVGRMRERRIREGQPAKVSFPLGRGTERMSEPAIGKVVYVMPVADAASDTQMVRVEVANPAGRPAGEHVIVDFPPQADPAEPTTQPAATAAPAEAPGEQASAQHEE